MMLEARGREGGKAAGVLLERRRAGRLKQPGGGWHPCPPSTAPPAVHSRREQPQRAATQEQQPQTTGPCLEQLHCLSVVQHGGARRRRGARQHHRQPRVVELAIVVHNSALKKGETAGVRRKVRWGKGREDGMDRTPAGMGAGSMAHRPVCLACAAEPQPSTAPQPSAAGGPTLSERPSLRWEQSVGKRDSACRGRGGG